jgi:hypothetical protein
MSTQSRDDAKGKDWMTDGVFVVDQYSPCFHVMCEHEKFLELRNALLALLPPDALVDDFNRENIEDITITDLSRDHGSKANYGFLVFLLVVFGAIAVVMTVRAFMT